MNRKQRRAGKLGASSAPSGQLYQRALAHQSRNQLRDAARLYERLLTLDPDHVEAINNLGLAHLGLGQLQAAANCFARLLMLAPQIADNYQSVLPRLYALNPALAAAAGRTSSAWPQRLRTEAVLEPAGFAALAADPLLCRVLELTTVRDVALERLLTTLRFNILKDALALKDALPCADSYAAPPDAFGFHAALAKQCFVNEYVFAQSAEEAAQAERLRDAVIAALAANAIVPPLCLLALAMYVPLHSVAQASVLLERPWPAAVAEVLEQQIREPWLERQHRDALPRLTPIDDAVSVRVRQQYEENPYPRWVMSAAIKAPRTLNEQLRLSFPSAPFAPLDDSRVLDVLIAGCGTGKQAIETALGCKNARILAVDLSLASLGYAKRKTPERLAGVIAYGQADILNLASLGKSFDLILASGVLHHMAEPLAAWRELLALLHPGGFMFVGLYSEVARRELTAARSFIAAKGYRPDAADIRRSRQDLIDSGTKGVLVDDFFSTSACRDLLFHVVERRFTLSDIKSFIDENHLTFIGFSFEPPFDQHYRSLFAAAGRSARALEHWQEFEAGHPTTFAAMYQFWVQKT